MINCANIWLAIGKISNMPQPLYLANWGFKLQRIVFNNFAISRDLIVKLFSDHPANKTHPASPGSLLPRLHLLWGRRSDVGPMDWAAWIHGHLVGLRMVPRHHVCRPQSSWTTWWRRHGSLQVQGWYCLLCPLLHCLPSGKINGLFSIQLYEAILL